MPSAKFALEAGGPKRLEVSWGAFWKNITIQLDGQEIGQIPTKAELDRGQSFPLPDGSTLHLKLGQSFGNVELQVTRDGRPLPGSATDPAQRVKTAGYILYFVAGLSALLGGAAVLFHVDLLLDAGIGWPAIAEAGVFAVLAFFTLRKSKIALILAIGLYILDGIMSLAGGLDAKGTPPIGMIFVRVILAMAMIRGVPAIDELKRGDDKDTKKASG